MNSRLQANEHIPLRQIMIKNFFGGIAWGLGSVLGASVILSIILWFLAQLDFIPFLPEILPQLKN